MTRARHFRGRGGNSCTELSQVNPERQPLRVDLEVSPFVSSGAYSRESVQWCSNGVSGPT